MKKFLILFAILLLTPSAMAQEKEVCLVYFTGYGCGDDCGLTDTFMDGLTTEYTENLTAITYYTDANQEAVNVFAAYRATYGLPSEIPIVLFGKNDYLQGITNIYNFTEKRIFAFLSVNGTNCPLEVGYVPPSQIGGQSLQGSPEITGKWGDADGGEEETNDSMPDDVDGSGLKTPFDLLLIKESERESLFSGVMILAAVMLVIIAVFLVWRKSFMEAD